MLYARAERVGAQLADLGALLHRTVADINANTGKKERIRGRREWRKGGSAPCCWLPMVEACPWSACIVATRPCGSPPHPSRPTNSCPAAASLGDTDSPLGKVVRILNNNLQALALIDARTEEARVRLNSLRASR